MTTSRQHQSITERSSQSEGQLTRNSAAHREPWKICVLVADDSAMDREWITMQLRGMDEYEAEIDQASSVAEASAMISAKPYHVVLTDYRLGDGYGDQIVRHCISINSCCAPILISGHAMQEVSLFGVRAAAAAAINKDDLNPSLLETTIRFALANKAGAPERLARHDR